ncbi:thiomuracin/GE37468 family thiazolyl RiPP peptide [Actinomadura harenae]|uniref:GE37468 family thiazolyl peptide n=1 Tax=Actinomadura harenae TaxID=2483351 RepID=A0A3M2LZ30_9ACTN|nr:thiomuracin/GE37468 family thiazolyl RiPP peptide [Actinomadura harenae]RMI42537.1 GE37468 family thiazolyl peptide [Actinomadura harenae]
MSKDFADLSDLPVDSIDVLPADGIEALDIGHGMTEVSASCGHEFTRPCGSCGAPHDGELDEF